MDGGMLLRLIDGELAGSEREEARAHLAACAACARELDALRSSAARVRAALDDSLGDVAPPPPPFRVVGAIRPAPRRAAPRAVRGWPWHRVAAAALLAVGLGAAAPPVRALVRQLVARARGAPAAPAAAPAPPAAAPAAVAERVIVEFTPEGSDVVVEFAAAQRAGTLDVAAHAAETVVLRAVAGSRQEVVVLPGGVRVRNAPTTAESYRLHVPARVRSLVVRVAGETVLTASGEELARREARVALGKGQ